MLVKIVIAVNLECKFEETERYPKYTAGDRFRGTKSTYYNCHLEKINLRKYGEVDQVIEPSHNNTNMYEQMVEISKSHLTFIPNEIFKQFPDLIYFYLHHCEKLNTLERSFFENAKNLKILWLDDNKFKILNQSVFAEAAKVEYLNLRNDQIEMIHLKAFDGLERLKALSLISNMIKFLKIDTFKNLVTLEEVFLIYNKLKIVDNVFKTNQNLKIVSFFGNEIEKIHPKIFSGDPELQIVDLDFRNNVCINSEFKNGFISNFTQNMSQCFYNFCENCSCVMILIPSIILLTWQIGILIFTALLIVLYVRLSRKLKLCIG